jgi:UPF0176 protein
MLYNRKSRELLVKELNKETFKRVTLSFYRYVILEDAQEFRDLLYRNWNKLNCFGRIYVAREGINAQMSIPEHNLSNFLQGLNNFPELKDMPIKYAVEDNGKSFYKLTIKVRPKVVADGLNDNAYDVTNVGRHLSPVEFHELAQADDTVVIDMRNHYESEVGKFEKAFCPDADTFREAIQLVEKEFEDQKEKKVLLYCTGGIRCEKASAYLKDKGFKDVNQLHGGIIAYAHEIKKQELRSNFVGKNFVFDQRLGESIDNQVIAKCHQCGDPCDTHTNCENDDCHLLFIQCKSCAKIYEGCCCHECKDVNRLPYDEKKKLRAEYHARYAKSKIYNSRLRPRLKFSTK